MYVCMPSLGLGLWHHDFVCLQEEVIQSVGKGCTGLLYLNLSYCYVTDSILRLLTKYCTNLMIDAMLQ